MKIQFNQILPINKSIVVSNKKISNKTIKNDSITEYSVMPNYSLATFPNISFGMSPDMRFLLNNAKRLKCAYSGRLMLSPAEEKIIYSKLEKRPNAMSAINFLQQYAKYMHDIEGKVFDFFVDSEHKNKRNFQDILLEVKDESLQRLKEKQIRILTKTNNLIKKLSPEIAAQIEEIRDSAIEHVNDNSFGRRVVLDRIKQVKATGDDLQKVIGIYRAWYKLPRSTNDFDAFVVKYSKKPHEAIAKRLISSSVATIEHVKPQSKGGDDCMSNILLVSSRFNNDRDTMPLDEFIMLNDELDVKGNLLRYIDDVINEVNDKRSPFSERASYPIIISDTIMKESKNLVIPSLINLKASKDQLKDYNSLQKLEQKYVVKKK